MPPLEDAAIFWDYENCPIPSNTSGYGVVDNIRSLARPYGSVKSFKAYLGISEQVSTSVLKSLTLRSELQSSGVSLVDCPHNGRKDVADKMIIVDMLAHAIDNPASSTVILITGDRDFAYAISILRLRRYFVVLVTLPNAHTSLKAQASLCFDWNSHILDPTNTSVRESNNTRSPFRERPRDPAAFGSSYRTENVDRNEHIDFEQIIRTATQNRPASQFPSNNSSEHANLEGPGWNTSVPGDVARLELQNGTASAHTLPSALPQRVGTNLSFTRNSEQSFTLNNLAYSGSTPSTTDLNDISHRSKLTTPADVTEQCPQHDPSAFIPADEESCSLAGQSYRSQYIPDTPLSFRPASAPCSLPVPSPPSTTAIPTPTVMTQTTLVSFPHPSATPSSSLPANAHLGIGVDGSATGSLIQPNPATAIPDLFKILVQSLQSHRSKGNPRPLRSNLSIEIAKNGLTYKKAGVEKFGQYVALAEKLGMVELGGREGGAWISLKPNWYGAS